MPIQHSPPARHTRFSSTEAPIRERTYYGRRSKIQEGRGPRRSSTFSGVVGGFPGLSRTTLKVPGEDDEEEEDNSVEEEESEGTEAAPAPVGESKGIGRPTLSQSD
ncbi:hypothetical protein O181_087955 [Austropuccinia psidii MF-1]|uniref:Uncharacterized protein n=1 Tax=Austropuccinia psidii MF-1 TaxID=1389203 RepID=A0A9Q3P2Y0_9BASI|nr:hypothetical protein [Austropuccinia psidii MF-1]